MYIVGKKMEKAKMPVDFYKFKRYYYGPYADELAIDLENLIQNNLVDHTINERVSALGVYEENVYQITNSGSMTLEARIGEIPFFQRISSIFTEVKEKYNDIPLSLLIQEIYSKYPPAH
jgi:uncharacterized protein YwgA